MTSTPDKDSNPGHAAAETPVTTAADTAPASSKAEASPGDSGAPTPSASPAARPWLPNPPQVHRYNDIDAIAEAAAGRFAEAAGRAVEKNDRFHVVLAGGSTPIALYRLLTQSPYRESIPWDRTYFTFSDERCVPPDDDASNYRMAQEALLGPLEISEHQVLRMKGEQAPADAARRYEVRLSDLFLNRPKRHFDLVLLGIGADGHTASLFPGTAALEETERWVAANEVPLLGEWRLTLTLPALSSARRIIFMATGEAKAKVIAEAFGGVEHATPHPCECVKPFNARREVLIDHAAASLIPRSEPRQESAESSVKDG